MVSAKRSDAWPMARSRSRTRRALSPMASPRCAAGTHWLIDHARRGGPRPADRPVVAAHRTRPAGTGGSPRARSVERRTWSQKSKATGGGGRGGSASTRSTKPQQRAGEVLRASSRASAASWPSTIASRRASSASTASIERARRATGSLSVVEDAAAVHRRRHRGGGVGQHRHAACGTPRSAARRSPRARSRRGRGRRPRSRR